MLCVSILQFVMPNLGWRWLLALSSLPSSVLLLFYGVTPESPRYLCMKGRISEAHNVLKKIARLNGTELPSGALVSDHHIQLHEKNVLSEDVKLLSPGRNEAEDQLSSDHSHNGLSSFFVLLSPSLLKSTLLLWVVFMGNAFSYYGLVLLTTELSKGRNQCPANNLHSEESHDVRYRDVFITSFAGKVYLAIFFPCTRRRGFSDSSEQ